MQLLFNYAVYWQTNYQIMVYNPPPPQMAPKLTYIETHIYPTKIDKNVCVNRAVRITMYFEVLFTG